MHGETMKMKPCHLVRKYPVFSRKKESALFKMLFPVYQNMWRRSKVRPVQMALI